MCLQELFQKNAFFSIYMEIDNLILYAVSNVQKTDKKEVGASLELIDRF